MTPVIFSALLVLPIQISREDVEMKLVFDTSEVARGDLVYCEVQLWNLTNGPIELPDPSPLADLLVEIEVSGTTIRTQCGCIGMGLPSGRKTVAPGSFISAPAEIVLWNQEVLQKVRHDQKTIRGKVRWAGLDRFEFGTVPFRVKVSGRVGSEDLLRKIYASSKVRAKAFRRAGSLEKHKATLLGAHVTSLITDSLLADESLARLLREVQAHTSVSRKATAGRLVIECATREEMQFDELRRRILSIVSKAGPAEQRWIILRSGSGLIHRGRTKAGQQVKQLCVFGKRVIP